LNIGDMLVPSPPHVEDGCPICEARKHGRVCTVGEYRFWLQQLGGPRAEKVLRMLAGVPFSAPMDPPSSKQAVYVTTSREYATWYAARSGNGDLYAVVPLSTPEPSEEDHFQSFTVASARVMSVLRRRVVLTRTERRAIEHKWRKADQRVDRERQQATELPTDDVRVGQR
jgi:predicted secreted protein